MTILCCKKDKIGKHLAIAVLFHLMSTFP